MNAKINTLKRFIKIQTDFAAVLCGYGFRGEDASRMAELAKNAALQYAKDNFLIAQDGEKFDEGVGRTAHVMNGDPQVSTREAIKINR